MKKQFFDFMRAKGPTKKEINLSRVKNYKEVSGKGVSFDNRWTMNSETLLNYYVPFPPLEEQDIIVNYINDKSRLIDEMINVKEQKIGKLQDYKKSLIYEYITGKKEV